MNSLRPIWLPESSTATEQRRLRNITITLEESVARWARLEAAPERH